MKKMIVIVIATAFGMVGAAPALAQEAPTTTNPCAEADDGQPEYCFDPELVDPETDILIGDLPPEPIPPENVPPSTELPGTEPPENVPPGTGPPVTEPDESVGGGGPDSGGGSGAAGTLPSTGSSAISGFLQFGALLLTGGVIFVIATRRRIAAQPSAS